MDIGLEIKVSVTVNDSGRTADQLRRIENGLTEVKGMIMSESAAIAEVAALVRAFTDDAAAKIDRLVALAENPDDSTTLSPEAQRELDGIRNVLTAARAASGIGDENNDGLPAADAPAVPTEGDGTVVDSGNDVVPLA